MNKDNGPLIGATVVIMVSIIAILIATGYSWGYGNGVDDTKTAPTATQAQRITNLEDTVEKLVNNEQISAETALRLDAMRTEFNTHIEESVSTSSTEETTTP